MLEGSYLSKLMRPGTVGWTAARALLASDTNVSGYAHPELDAITVSVAGSHVQLNNDQVRAVNLFNKEYPIQIVDSAYGAGKSLCTAVMANESAKLGYNILVTAVQNSALDVIGAKIAELQSPNIRAI
ncbi:hypothetical protein GCK32_022707, partial [Trichostrongylus colubriformis]